ncbi:MAG: hypothetical protein ACO20F_11865, partial [Robiginitalea sp.]
NEKQQSGFAGLGFLFAGAGIFWIMSAASNPAKLVWTCAGEMKNNNPALPDWVFYLQERCIGLQFRADRVLIALS